MARAPAQPAVLAAPGSARPHERLLILEPGRAERTYWADLWTYRELFAILAWRDVAVRYKQTVIGVAWAIVRPLLTMVIFTVLFGTLARLPSDGATPYPLLVFAGMLPWFLFSSILSDASHSLIGNAGLIGKVYLAPVYNYLIAQGLRIGVYEVAASAMHGLGTPEDLEAYVARRSMSAKGARS
jgi:ABC-type polysaccharide/polyol phosphate export permease